MHWRNHQWLPSCQREGEYRGILNLMAQPTAAVKVLADEALTASSLSWIQWHQQNKTVGINKESVNWSVLLAGTNNNIVLIICVFISVWPMARVIPPPKLPPLLKCVCVCVCLCVSYLLFSCHIATWFICVWISHVYFQYHIYNYTQQLESCANIYRNCMHLLLSWCLTCRRDGSGWVQLASG